MSRGSRGVAGIVSQDKRRSLSPHFSNENPDQPQASCDYDQKAVQKQVHAAVIVAHRDVPFEFDGRQTAVVKVSRC